MPVAWRRVVCLAESVSATPSLLTASVNTWFVDPHFLHTKVGRSIACSSVSFQICGPFLGEAHEAAPRAHESPLFASSIPVLVLCHVFPYKLDYA